MKEVARVARETGTLRRVVCREPAWCGVLPWYAFTVIGKQRRLLGKYPPKLRPNFRMANHPGAPSVYTTPLPRVKVLCGPFPVGDRPYLDLWQNLLVGCLKGDCCGLMGCGAESYNACGSPPLLAAHRSSAHWNLPAQLIQEIL